MSYMPVCRDCGKELNQFEWMALRCSACVDRKNKACQDELERIRKQRRNRYKEWD